MRPWSNNCKCTMINSKSIFEKKMYNIIHNIIAIIAQLKAIYQIIQFSGLKSTRRLALYIDSHANLLLSFYLYYLAFCFIVKFKYDFNFKQTLISTFIYHLTFDVL